jgi:CBS domain containing-hemolysin-like protein
MEAPPRTWGQYFWLCLVLTVVFWVGTFVIGLIAPGKTALNNGLKWGLWIAVVIALFFYK